MGDSKKNLSMEAPNAGAAPLGSPPSTVMRAAPANPLSGAGAYNPLSNKMPGAKSPPIAAAQPPKAANQSPTFVPPSNNAQLPIGVLLEVSGAGSHIAVDQKRMEECLLDADPTVNLAGQVGSPIKVRVGAHGWLLGSVRDQRQDRRAGAQGSMLGAVDFLGEGMEDPGTGKIYGFRRGITRYPNIGAYVYPATTEDLRQIYASDGRPNIRIGTVFPTQDITAALYIDSFLGKHFALVGSTGTGKSTSAALILHRICEFAPDGHIVMIDPHGEYATAFKDKGQILDVSNLQMPYWLMNFEEHCEVFLTSRGAERDIDKEILAKSLLKARSKSRHSYEFNRITVDSPIPYLLSDLAASLNDEMGKLDKATNSAPFVRIKAKLEEVRVDPRYQFMFSGLLVADVMTSFLGRVFRIPSNGKPISIVDVSGVPSEITKTVVAVLSRLVFDFAIWGKDELTGPILLVCEEAHRYVPNEKNIDGSSVGNILSRIAKEGRKYGVSLGLITQRPSDLAEGVLSQCGTIISLRLNNERDQSFVKAAMPEGARGFLDAISSLRNRQCIVCGEGVPIPVRVNFDPLEKDKCPASHDPSFAALWAHSDGKQETVARIVAKWRGGI